MACGRRLWILVAVALMLVAAATGLITWLVLRYLQTLERSYEIINLEGSVGAAEQRAAFTRFRRGAHMFWWFYPAVTRAAKHTRPLLVWLDGVAGPPPSVHANFAAVGPYDYDLEPRNHSWVNDYNILFVDAPVGSGFSFLADEDQAVKNLRENSEDLLRTLHSFLSSQEGLYASTPLYILGQGFGSRMAVEFALLLQEHIDKSDIECSLRGVILGNPILSPAMVTSKLGFYLEQLGYVDAVGRAVVEEVAVEMAALVDQDRYEEAFELWKDLDHTVADTAGAVAVNLRHVVDKLTRDSADREFCRICDQRRTVDELKTFMDAKVAPELGVASGVTYHSQSHLASRHLEKELMKPAQHSVEKILQDTDLSIWIYNGNLDAISNTPGQLKWIEELSWAGAEQWADSARIPIALDGILEGYERSASRLHLYWVNVAGHDVAIDSPTVTRHILRLIAAF